MKEINKIEIVIVLKPGIIRNMERAQRNAIQVIAENENYYCLNDDSFSSIRKTGDRFYTVIDRPSISFHINDKCFGSQIWYTCYTFKNKKATTIIKEIESAVLEKFGSFQNIDLTFLRGL